MRWTFKLGLFLAIIAGLMTVAFSAAGARARPHVTVSSVSEPPDFRGRGGTFSVAFTVANQGRARAASRVRLRSYLVKKAGKPRRGDRRLRGSTVINALGAGKETSRRIRVRIPRTTRPGLYFLTVCVIKTRAGSSKVENNNCRVSGQRLRVKGPKSASKGGISQFRVDRTSLPIGRPLIGPVTMHNPPGGGGVAPGDAEKSDQRKELFKVGPVHVVADCKRTSNGDDGQPDAAPTSPGSFDEDGDEAKILIYTDTGSVTFNSLGNSSRRNIPAGEGTQTPDRDPNPSSHGRESSGGEGKHMAIAAARDPDQSAPENDWVTAYKVGSIYVAHSAGQEFTFTGYAGIDVLGLSNQCGFGGVVTVLKS
jgi:hypothetical protein